MSKSELPALNKSDFINLEALRGLAAFYVLLNHSRGHLWVGGDYIQSHQLFDSFNLLEKGFYYLNFFTRVGTEFVILFFILSGFSIAYSLSRNSNYGAFIKKRGIRLYPPYLAAIVWALAAFWLSKWLMPSFYTGVHETDYFNALQRMSNFDSPSNIAKILFYIPAAGIIIGQFWSLAHEVIFYIISPLLVKKHKIYVFISLGLFVINLLTNVVGMVENDIVRLLMQFIFQYNFFFAIGIYLFYNFNTINSFLNKWFLVIKSGLSILLFLAMVGINY